MERIYMCEVCNATSEDMTAMKIHIAEHNIPDVIADQENPSENENPDSLESTSNNIEANALQKVWTEKNTFLLIELVEKFDKEFQTRLKSVVWKKIAEIINRSDGTSFSPQQVDSKWKGLKRTYQEIKKHNSTSGNSRKKWVYFDLLHNFLFKKPEINPVATCSSTQGLIVRQENESEKEDTNNEKQTPKKHDEYKSSFMNKRKLSNTSFAEKKHGEKMARADRFLDIFERVAAAMEKKEN